MAFHQYHEKYGCFPPAYIADEAGRPLHSWRVLILPFMEYEPLYERYRFDEPWNGPNNSKLADEIPEPYQCPSFTKNMIRFDKMTARESRMTNYLVITGPKTAFDHASCVSVRKIEDGTSNTILVVETRERRVNWMQPEDVSIDDLAPRFQLSPDDETHVGGFHVLLFDGSVRFLNVTISPELLHALCTANGGEEIHDF